MARRKRSREAPSRAVATFTVPERRLIARLPERSRMIVILRFQEDLDPAEIAEVLGIPLGTVKSNLHRSLAVLRGKLQREGKGVSR